MQSTVRESHLKRKKRILARPFVFYSSPRMSFQTIYLNLNLANFICQSHKHHNPYNLVIVVDRVIPECKSGLLVETVETKSDYDRLKGCKKNKEQDKT